MWQQLVITKQNDSHIKCLTVPLKGRGLIYIFNSDGYVAHSKCLLRGCVDRFHKKGKTG